VEYVPTRDLQDSIVYEYRPDGRISSQSHYREYGGPPWEIISWEYQAWQVPLALRPSVSRAGGRNPATLPGRNAIDLLGRTVWDRPGAPSSNPENRFSY